jgi:Spy/CpxP family protein refolding chaperone
MKKLLTIAALAAAVTFSSQIIYARGMNGYGYSGAGCGMGPGMMFECLDLTDEQADKIHKLNKEYREKAWKDRVEHRKAVEKILTPEQKKKREDARKNRGRDWKKGSKKKGNKYNRDDRRGLMMGPGLDLTDEQIEKIHKINSEYADKFHRNRKNADELKKLRESRDREIEKVLTKEQLEKVKDFRGKRGYGSCPYLLEY